MIAATSDTSLSIPHTHTIPQVHLTDDHFENFRAKEKRFLLMMHAPWCGHCKAAKPDFVAASKRFLKRTFRFAAIDCTEDGSETCAALGVKSYPTFLYVFFEVAKCFIRAIQQ